MANSEKQLKDLVIPLSRYPHMPYWATLKEAVVQLTLAQKELPPDERRRTVLVFDEAYRLKGILTQRNILKGIEPRFSEKVAEGYHLDWQDLVNKPSQEQLAKPISDFMSPIQATVERGDSLLKASHVMISHGLGLLPVMDGPKVAGVVRLQDVFMELGLSILGA
jgi:CBS-domain-containing membrane protein